MTRLGTINRRPGWRCALLCGTALVGAMALMVPEAMAQNATWNGLGGPAATDYSTGANWVGNAPAAGTGSTATFGSLGSASTTVTLDHAGNFDIGTIRVQDSKSYTFNKTGGPNIFGIHSGLDIQAGSSATFNISAGTMQFLGGSAQTAAINVLAGGTVEFQNLSDAGSATIDVANSSTALFFGSSRAGTAQFTVGFSTILGFRDNANAGNATITSAGLVDFRYDASAGNASITTTAGGSVEFRDNATAGAATISTTGSTILFYHNSSGGSAAFTLSGGVLDISFHNTGVTVGSIASADPATIIMLGSRTLTTGGNNTSTTYAGRIVNGPGSLVKVGTGTLTLTNFNGYSGGTTISGGALNVQNNSALGIGAVTVNGGGTLELQGGVTVNNAITLNGAGFGNTGALRNIAGVNNNITGAITLASNAHIVSDGNQLLLNTITSAGASLTVDGAGNTSAGDVTLGTGGITKEGAGGFGLFGVSSYTGATTVNNGLLQLSSGSAIPDTSAVTLTGTGRLNLTSSETIGSLAGSGDVALNGMILTTGGNGSSTTYSGAISGNGADSLVKTGTGTFTLTGSSGYTGVTTLAQGGIAVGANTALGAGVLSVTGDTTLSNANNLSVALANFIGLSPGQTLTLTSGVGPGGGGDLRLNGRISGTGALVINNASTSSVALFGDNNYNGGTTLNGGQVSVGHDNAFGLAYVTVSTLTTLFTGAPALTIGNNFNLIGAGLNIANNNDLTLSGVLSGAGGLGKSIAGTGRLTLSGANTYAGTTTVNGGELRLSNGVAIPDASAVTLTGTGQLSLLNSETIGSLAGSGNVGLNGQTLTTGGNNTSTVYSGVVSGTAASGFVKTGTGTLVLSGFNAGGSQFTGTTTVNQGILRVEGAFGDTIGNAAGVTIASNGTLQGNGTIHGNVTVQNNGTLSPGASPGTLTIAGDLTLDTGSTSKFELGTPGVVGGTTNDLVKVGGNLTLGGELKADVASAGYYRLFEYGTLAPGRTFDTETVTSTNFTVASHTVGLDVPGQVYLIALGAGQTIQFWDGGNATPNFVDGGTGTWDGAGFNWTDVNGAVNLPWMRSVGVFAGSPGTVTVAGTQNFDTLQFVTDGYHLAGGSLAFNPASGSAGTVAVDGGITAFVGSVLTDGTTATDFVKAGNGTLILTGTNTYTGTTSIQGTLQLGDGGNTGSIGGGTVLNDGMLAFDRSDSFIFANDITGAGGLTQTGTGTVTLTGSNGYSGTTEVNQGTLIAGTGSALSDASAFKVDTAGTLQVADAIGVSIGSLADGSTGGGKVVIGTSDPFTGLETGFDDSDTIFSGVFSGSGTLVKQGTGTMTLKGRGSALGGDLIVNQGSVVLDGGSFELGGAVQLGTLLAVVNGGTLMATDPLKGIILPVGSIHVDGAGSAIPTAGLTQVLNFLPGDTVVTISNGGVFNSKGGADVEGSTAGSAIVNVTGAGSAWNVDNDLLLGCACGNAVLNIADGGVVNSTGDTVIDVGSRLNLGLGGRAGSIVTATIENDGEIVANFTDTTTLDAKIVGAGTLTKLGTGTLALNGANTYTGATTVHAGKLVVGDSSHPGASLASIVTVKSGASLGGLGTLGGLVAEGGAVVAPGNSIGTLNVAGDVTLGAGSTYEVEIAGNGTSDRIAATGKATLGGGKVGVTTLDLKTSYQNGQTYTILTAAGGISGGFDPAVLSHSAFLDATLLQSAKAVDLKIALKEQGPVFGKAANTENQKQTAAALDTLQQSGTPLELYNKLLVLSADEARSAFDGLSGEVNASTVTGLLEDSRFTRDAINDRLRSAFETVGAEPLPLMGYGDDAKDITTASVPSERYGAWGSVFGSWGYFSSDGNAARLSRSTGGFVTGVDGLVTDDVRLGFLAGYSHSSLKVDDRRSSASTDNYHLGIYGGTEWGALALRSGLAYTWSEIESSRQVAFPGFTDSLTGSYRAGTTQLFGELGYGIKAGNVAFEPFANLAYVNVHTNGFTEKGGASALTVYSGSNDSTFTTLGIRAATDFDLGSAKATVRGMIGWRHGYGDVTPTVSQAFTGSNAFSIAGAPIARDAAVLEAGLDFAIAPTATLGISYHGQVGSRASDHGVRADLNVKF